MIIPYKHVEQHSAELAQYAQCGVGCGGGQRAAPPPGGGDASADGAGEKLHEHAEPRELNALKHI